MMMMMIYMTLMTGVIGQKKHPRTETKTADSFSSSYECLCLADKLTLETLFTVAAVTIFIQDPIDGGEFNLGDVKQPTDFANPMYDALGTVPGDGKPLVEDVSGIAISGSGTSGSAILTPSVITQMSSPQLKFKKKALNPTSKDTDKDTAMLVEEDASEA